MDLFRTQSYTHRYERKSPLTYSFLNTKAPTFSKLCSHATYTVLYVRVCSRLRCSMKVLSHHFLSHIQQTSGLLRKKNLGFFWLIYCACTRTHTPFRSQTAMNIGSSDLFTVNHVGCRRAAAGTKLTCLATTYLDWCWSRFCMGMPPNAATATMIPCTTLQWDEQQQWV